MVFKRTRRKDDDEFWDEIYDFLENADREYRRFLERFFDTFDEIENLKDQPGTYVYGFTYKIGPDGKPIFQEFGNIPRELSGLPGPEFREPLTDIQDREAEYDITIELPGVDKNEIDLEVTEDMMTVKVDKPDRKYYKEIPFDEKVDPESVKATYSNGILDVIVKKKSPKKKETGKKIRIE
jgi:Molecular chaperone (small heat shock protein)